MLTKIQKTNVKGWGRRFFANVKYPNPLLPWLLGVSLLVTVSCRPGSAGGDRPIRVEYPSTPFDSTALVDYHGVTVADPYRWLENDTSEAALRWVGAQRAVTDAFLQKIPFRELLDSRLRHLLNYERYTVPMARDSFFFVFRNDGLQSRDILYRTDNPNGGTMVPVLDPAALGAQTTLISESVVPSTDGSRLAFQVSAPEPGWRWILVKDLREDRFLADTLRGVKFPGIAWFGDGFFYSRFAGPAPGQPRAEKIEFQQLYYHRLGAPQAEDELVFADRTNPELLFAAQTTADERFLILHLWDKSHGNALYLRDLSQRDQVFEPIVESFDHRFSVVGSQGDHLWVLTDFKAPRRRLIRIDARRPGARYWKELIPEDKEQVMVNVYPAADHLFVVYRRPAGHRVSIFDLEGRFVKDLDLPGPGTVTTVEGAVTSRRAYLGFTSFTRPLTVYEVNLADQSILSHRTPTFNFDADAFLHRQVWVEGSDGYQMPMFILHRKGMELNGRAPALIVVNGGDERGMIPAFNFTGFHLLPIVLENGGIVAVPLVRGADGFGREWLEAGSRAGKQLAVNDLLAAGDYLIANRYTSADRLAAFGVADGGMLVAAGLMKRPDLFAVALLSGGAYDLLRYQHLSTDWSQAAAYGTSDDPEAFNWLLSLSPVHQVLPAKYPAVLIDAGSDDWAMSPVHACKLAAVLQAGQQGQAPVLLRFPPPGHPSDRIDENADLLAFLFYQLQYPPIYEEQ